MVLAYLDQYEAAVTQPGPPGPADAEARGPVWELLGRCALGTQTKLLDERTVMLKDGTRRIIRAKNRDPAIKGSRADEVRAAVEAYGAAVGRPEYFRPLDVAGRVAGIGSLGVRRYTVLVNGGGTSETNRLLDLKECRPSALGGCASRPWPYPDASDAARVVRAQRMLQARPAASLEVLPVGGTEFRLREMVPEENRTSLDRFKKKPGKLRAAVEEAGRLTGLSHRRGAAALPGPKRDALKALARWATGPALDSVLAAAVRFAERTRADHARFRAGLRDPASLPEELRKRYCR
jgi:uncharacterized protein (DUF2252 family)